MGDFLQVQTTAADRETIETIGRELVEARLAACAQTLGPIHSTYRWRGELTADEEWLLLLKVRAADYDLVERELRGRHPYEEPEIVATPIVAGSASYLAWATAETSRDR